MNHATSTAGVRTQQPNHVGNENEDGHENEPLIGVNGTANDAVVQTSPEWRLAVNLGLVVALHLYVYRDGYLSFRLPGAIAKQNEPS